MRGSETSDDLSRGSVSGRIHSVETLGATDGPGLRYVVFLQGCPLHCGYCHNPDTRICDAGETKTADALCEDILRYQNYLTGGVTFSGGEPLIQARFVRAAIQILHDRANMHAAIDTSGHIITQEALSAVDEADLILLDIKAFDEITAVRLTGFDTKNAIQLLEHCEKTGKPVWIRHVLVPDHTIFENDTTGQIADTYERFCMNNHVLYEGICMLSRYACIKRIELLPYHKLGEFKWAELGLRSPLEETPEPSEASVAYAGRIVAEVFTQKKIE